MEHPEIGWMERTGYPSWMQEPEEDDEDLLDEEDDEDYDAAFWGDEDRAYDERRDRELFGDLSGVSA